MKQQIKNEIETSDLIIPGKPQINATPPPPITNYSHPGCYARALNDCSTTISREHYISKQVLELWGDHGIVSTNMHNFIPDQLSQLDIKNLAQNILCQRHNNSLSSLDDIGGDFARFVKNVPPQQSVINGCDLERWFLKLFLGLSNRYQPTEEIKSWQPSKVLLDVLFNKRPFDKDCGLYGLTMQNVIGPVRGWHIKYTFDKTTQEGVGIFVCVDEVTLFFGIVPLPSIPTNEYIQCHYHPASLVISENFDVCREIHTGWVNDSRLTFFQSNR